MEVRLEIANNFFYIPTKDLKSAMVATGNISIHLYKKDRPPNWEDDLTKEKEIKILKIDLGEKYDQVEKKKNLAKSLIEEVTHDEEKPENLWLSELPVENRRETLKIMKTEQKLLKLHHLMNDKKSMELDLQLENFEIYLTDFRQIMEVNSKIYQQRMAKIKTPIYEEEDIMETKEEEPKKKEKEKRKPKPKGHPEDDGNKRELLKKWTFDLNLVEYKGYKEIEDKNEQEERMNNLVESSIIPVETNKMDQIEERKKSDSVYIETGTVKVGAEGEGEVQFPVIKLVGENNRKYKAIMHNDKLIAGKLNQLIFDISLKDIQMIQKIYTFHFGVFSDHTNVDQEGEPKLETNPKKIPEKKSPIEEEDVMEETEINNINIDFVVAKPVRISLVNDFENVFVRSLVIQIQKLQIKGNLATNSDIMLGFGLEMMYYNSGLTSWEPVLEKTNMMVNYIQKVDSVEKQLNDILEEKMRAIDEEKAKKSKKKKKKKKKRKISNEEVNNITEERRITLMQLKEDHEQKLSLETKSQTIIKVIQGIKMEEFEGEDGIKIKSKEGETMNLNITIAFLEKLIFFQNVFESLKKEGEEYSKELGHKGKKLLEIKEAEGNKIKTKKGKKGEGIVSPARVVNRTGYPIKVEYQKKQVFIKEGNMRIEQKDRVEFTIGNMESHPLFWDNFTEENLFNSDDFGNQKNKETQISSMDTFYYKTISFQIQHPKFNINYIKSLSLNDNFDRKIVTKGKQRILTDFRVLCNSRNIGDLKEITIGSQVLIENQLLAKGCRRIINIETIHPYGRSIITVKPGQKKYVPFDLISFKTRIYANKDRMIPDNFKFNNFILKERNYKTIFHSKNYSFNFVLKVERDPKFFYLTRLVVVPAISFKNDLPFPCEVLLSNGVQQELITLKQGDFVKKCNLNIMKKVTFMMGILRKNVIPNKGKENKRKIVAILKSNPFQRYHFKSKGKLILQNGHLGSDYKKVLSLYNSREEKTYFSMVRWITRDSYFGFLLYSDSAIINETPYAFEFRGADTNRQNLVDVVPQIERELQEDVNQVSLLSSKRSTLEIKLQDQEKSKMRYFSEKFSNKITTQGFVNGVFIINMTKIKKKAFLSQKKITKPDDRENPNITQSLFVGGTNSQDLGNAPTELGSSMMQSGFTTQGNQEIFPNSQNIMAKKMYLEIGHKVSLVYSNENKGTIATKVIHLCPKTIVSNETEFELSIKQKEADYIYLEPGTKKPIFAFVGEGGKDKFFQMAVKQDLEIFTSRVDIDFNKGGTISLIMLNRDKNRWKVVRIEMLIEDSYMFVKVSDRTNKKDMIIKNNLKDTIRIYQVKQKENFSQILLSGEVKEMSWVDPYADKKIKFEILGGNKKMLETISERVVPKEPEFQQSKANMFQSMIKLPKKVELPIRRGATEIKPFHEINIESIGWLVIDEGEIEIQNLKKAEIKTKGNRELTVDIKLKHQSRLIEIESRDTHIIEKEEDFMNEKSGGTDVLTFLLSFSQLGVSLIAKTNRQRRELFYLYINDINFFYENEGPHTSVQFQIRYLNIDNNYSSQCRFPVLFTCGQSLNEMIIKDRYMINCILKMIDVESENLETVDEINPNDHPSKSEETIEEQKILCFDEITLELSPLSLTVEFSIINVMSEFLKQLEELKTSDTVEKSYLNKYFISPEQLAIEENPEFSEDSEWKTKDIESTVWIYCNKFDISCLKCIVTFNMNQDESGELSKSEDSYFNVITNTLGSTILNFDESPLSFSGIKLFYVFESSNGLISLYKQHLMDQGKINVMKVLGSIDILGNPTNLFGNVGNGMVQFFEQPVEGFKKGPISGIKGIATGSTALLKNTAAGTLNAISKFTGSLASGLTTLSNDKTYQRQRNLKKAKKPKGVLEGLESGAQSIGKGVWSGVTGIITQPIKEVKRSGAIGIFKGLFKGITGIVTKPLGGILDATSQTTEGIKKTITKYDDKANEFKQRPPRVFYSDKKLIKMYDNKHAQRIKALVKVDSNLETESLIDSVELSLQFGKIEKKCILVITNNFFVVLNESLNKIYIKCEIIDVKKVEFSFKSPTTRKKYPI